MELGARVGKLVLVQGRRYLPAGCRAPQPEHRVLSTGCLLVLDALQK